MKRLKIKPMCMLAVAIIMALAAVVVTPIHASASSEITVTIDGERVVFPDQGPIIVQGRTLVPVRDVFEALGFEADWNRTEQQAELTRDDYVIIIPIGSSTFTTNGVSYELDVPAQIIAGRTLLPLRAVLESVGYELDWDGSTRTVIITTPGVDAPTPARVFDATFLGRQSIMQWLPEYSYREFWRLEDAYEYFRNNPLYNEVLPFSEYPVKIEIGQVFVIRYTRPDGSYRYEYLRSSGLVWNGMDATERFRVTRQPSWVVVGDYYGDFLSYFDLDLIRTILGTDFEVGLTEYVSTAGIYVRILEIPDNAVVNTGSFQPYDDVLFVPTQVGDVILCLWFGEPWIAIDTGPAPDGGRLYIWIDLGQYARQLRLLQERLEMFDMSRHYTSASFYWYSNDERAEWLTYMAVALEERMVELLELFGLEYLPGRQSIRYYTLDDFGIAYPWMIEGLYETWGHRTPYWSGHAGGGLGLSFTRTHESTIACDGTMRILVHEAVHEIQFWIPGVNMRTAWLIEGTARYLSWSRQGIAYSLRNRNAPTIAQLENNEWFWANNHQNINYSWGASVISFISNTFGFEYIVELHRNPDIAEVFGISRAEFQRQWHQYLRDSFR